MNTNSPLCVADDEGRSCHREAVVLRPVALCHPHRIEIALTVVPGLLRDGLEAAMTSVATGVAVRDDLIATATATPVDGLLHGVHDSVVYFIANGGRVKIGYTTNLKSRLSALALRSDAVLLALQGGPELERALHARFAQYRNGNTEWFELAPEIFRYIAAPHPTATAPVALRSAVAVQASQRAQGVAAVARLLARNPGVTSARVADELGVSRATAKRYLREARQGSRP